MEESKNAEEIKAIASVRENKIVLTYLHDGVNHIIEIPKNEMNNHIKDGDSVELALYILMKE